MQGRRRRRCLLLGAPAVAEAREVDAGARPGRKQRSQSRLECHPQVVPEPQEAQEQPQAPAQPERMQQMEPKRQEAREQPRAPEKVLALRPLLWLAA